MSKQETIEVGDLVRLINQPPWPKDPPNDIEIYLITETKITALGELYSIVPAHDLSKKVWYSPNSFKIISKAQYK